jgi:PAS domain S-box-containing protein
MGSIDSPPQEHAVVDDTAHLYRLLAETIPLMVWTAGAEGGVEFVNRRVLEYAGLPAAELEGSGWEKIVHPDDRQRCLETWQAALRSGESVENEMRLRRADGEYRWHHGSGVALRGVDGRIVRWFGVCSDIEERVRGEHLLESLVQARTREVRAARERLGAIIDTQPECVKMLDAEGCLLEMNAAGLRMIEAGPGDGVFGRCIYPLVVEEHRAAFRELTERVCRGERGTLEFEIVGLKGTRRWLETHAVPFLEEGSPLPRLLAVTRDISDRKRAEQALRESERRFRAFMDNVPAQAWIKDAAFRYAYLNRELSDGRGAPSVLGRNDFELWPEKMARRIRASDEAALHAGGKPMQSVQTAPRTDGRTAHWLMVKFALPDAAGGVAIGGIGIDLTERIEAERQAALYAEEARGLMHRLVTAQESERRRVAADLHDLIGQNLTALAIDLKALKQRLGEAGHLVAAPRIDAMAGLLEKTIDSIRGVMTDLRPVALEEFGLEAALRGYTATFAERTGMRVSMRVAGDEVRLPPERELAVFRVAQEALTNAAKHSGGSAIEIRLERGARRLAVSVADDGHGFAAGPGSAERGRDGWGLSAMRERAEAHGGSLRVESDAAGTRVTVEVPLADAG